MMKLSYGFDEEQQKKGKTLSFFFGNRQIDSWWILTRHWTGEGNKIRKLGLFEMSFSGARREAGNRVDDVYRFYFFFLEVCFHIGNHQIAITVLLESN